MVYEVLHSVLVNGARLASAVLPAAPLLGLKRPAAFGQEYRVVQDALSDGEAGRKVIRLMRELGYPSRRQNQAAWPTRCITKRIMRLRRRSWWGTPGVEFAIPSETISFV